MTLHFKFQNCYQNMHPRLKRIDIWLTIKFCYKFFFCVVKFSFQVNSISYSFLFSTCFSMHNNWISLRISAIWLNIAVWCPSTIYHPSVTYKDWSTFIKFWYFCFFKEWTHATSKGMFYIDEETEKLLCHQYNLKLTEDTSVWITIQPIKTRCQGEL